MVVSTIIHLVQDNRLQAVHTSQAIDDILIPLGQLIHFARIIIDVIGESVRRVLVDVSSVVWPSIQSCPYLQGGSSMVSGLVQRSDWVTIFGLLAWSTIWQGLSIWWVTLSRLSRGRATMFGLARDLELEMTIGNVKQDKHMHKSLLWQRRMLRRIRMLSWVHWVLLVISLKF